MLTISERLDRSDSLNRVEKNPQLSIEDALVKTGFGKFNILLALTCGLILFAVNCECYAVSYILPAAECDLGLDVKDKSILASITVAGVLSSQFLWGFISDTRGRKNTLLITLALSFLSTLGSSVAPNLWSFALLRFTTGVFIASSSATVFAYLGEFMSNKYRSAVITGASVFVGLAYTSMPGLGWLILPMTFKINIFNQYYSSWRLFVLICGLPTLIACIAMLFFPESPKFLLEVGKNSEAIEVLKKMHSFNNIRGDFQIDDLKNTRNTQKNTVNIVEEFFSQISGLFKPKHLKKTLMVCGLQFGIFCNSAGVLIWYPEILLRLSKTDLNITVCSSINLVKSVTATTECNNVINSTVFEQNILLGCAYLIGFLAVSSLIGFFGCKIILAVLAASSGLCGLLLFWASDKMMINILFMVYLALSGVCVSVVNCAVVDLFPTSLRAMAVCVAMFCGRLGSVTSSSILGFLLEWNCDVTFISFSSILILCALLALFLPKRRKTVE